MSVGRDGGRVGGKRRGDGARLSRCVSLPAQVSTLIDDGYRHYGVTQHHVIQPREFFPSPCSKKPRIRRIKSPTCRWAVTFAEAKPIFARLDIAHELKDSQQAYSDCRTRLNFQVELGSQQCLMKPCM